MTRICKGVIRVVAGNTIRCEIEKIGTMEVAATDW